MRIAEEIGLGIHDRSTQFCALLLNDAGCSTNASKITALYGAAGHAVQRGRTQIDHTSAMANLGHAMRDARHDRVPRPRGVPARAQDGGRRGPRRPALAA
jgi:hypothetical protein